MHTGVPSRTVSDAENGIGERCLRDAEDQQLISLCCQTGQWVTAWPHIDPISTRTAPESAAPARVRRTDSAAPIMFTPYISGRWSTKCTVNNTLPLVLPGYSVNCNGRRPRM